MSNPINWKAMAWRLARPWWGPDSPDEYVLTYLGQKAGIGLLHDYNYGAWNLMLAAQGHYGIPATREEHAAMVPVLIACRTLAAHPVEGQPMGSYAMLMNPIEFKNWVQRQHSAGTLGLPSNVHKTLVKNLCTLLKSAHSQ